MHNGWDIAVEFYYEHRKGWPLYIWSRRTQYKGSSVLNVVATSLPLECCGCLDWSQISTEKTHHNRSRHSSLKHVVVVKSSFSRFLLVSSFPAAFTSLSSTVQGLYERSIPLPSSDSITSICLLPYASPVYIFPTVFPSGFRIWIKVMCFLSNRTICMNLLLCLLTSLLPPFLDCHLF
jgi:hypothetical protein